MHGVDWKAMRAKYCGVPAAHRRAAGPEPRDPLDAVSELSVGHSYITNVGDTARAEDRARRPARRRLRRSTTAATGSRRCTAGLNWNPELRSPLTEPGVEREGGRVPARRRRQGRQAARRTSTASSRTRRASSIEITVAPERRRRRGRARSRSCRSRASSRCATATGSRATCARWTRRPAGGSPTSTCRTPPTAGYTYFKRYFYPAGDKDAVIVDERFNGGGSVADYYIDILRRS